MKLENLDDLFQSESITESIKDISTSDLYEFLDHPFSVSLDDEFLSSVREQGIYNPLLVRPRLAGGYEIISGHRRHTAANVAGLTKVPCIVRNIDDDTAVIMMADSNLQRPNIPITEKARALKMKVEALLHKGKKTADGEDSYSLVAEESGLSRTQLSRFLRIANLHEDLSIFLESKKIAFNTAVELSYLTAENQELLANYLLEYNVYPKLEDAKKLRLIDVLTEEIISGIMIKRRLHCL